MSSEQDKALIELKVFKELAERAQLPIELLCYTNARVVSPDDLIIAVAKTCATSTEGRFRKIWLLGEKGVYEVWKAT